jgi:ParB family chromosome partitioning protein
VENKVWGTHTEMLVSSNSYSNILIGAMEDLNIADIIPPLTPLRSDFIDVPELASSIKNIGLLTPIIVRTTSSGTFEIVAGNRRFRACKSLGWKKIPCQIMELDDKSAFEVSIIENVQRHTLNIMEEGYAFRRYVNDFGWGGVSELANKVSKSPSYISKRMRLAELPQDVIDLISGFEISISAGEELLSIKDVQIQSKLALLARDESLSSRNLRSLIKREKEVSHDFNSIHDSLIEERDERISKTFDKSIVVLKIAISKLATILSDVEDTWLIHDMLVHHKNEINSQIDMLIREKKKYIKRKIGIKTQVFRHL